MRRLLPFLVLPLLALVACGGRGADDGFSPQALAAAATAAGTVNGLCPVMLKPVILDLSSTHQGQKVGFCCPPCKPQFDKDPERYMKRMRDDPARFAYTPPS